MTTLKYWDASLGQYVNLAPSGPSYVTVAAAAPNANAPTVTPPNGFLWVDTTTTGQYITTPYVPAQTPPATGTNSFTDSSGEVWISRNGSPWKRARDALHANVGRAAAYTFTGTLTAVPFDTVGVDTYAMYTSPNFIVPIAGRYHVDYSVAYSPAGLGSWMNTYISRNGTGYYNTNTVAVNTGGLSAHNSGSVVVSAGDQISVMVQGSASMNLFGDTTFNWFMIDYLGTG
jgi:hypothetical protein